MSTLELTNATTVIRGQVGPSVLFNGRPTVCITGFTSNAKNVSALVNRGIINSDVYWAILIASEHSHDQTSRLLVKTGCRSLGTYR